jgi:hypothetical protein
MSILDWSIQQATLTTAQIAASSYIPLTGQLVWNSQTGQYKIGDGSTALSALTYYGGSASLAVGTSAITGGTNTRILYNNNGVLGEYSVTGSGTTAVLSTSPTFTTDITTPLILGGASSYGDITISPTSNVNKGYIYLGSSGDNNVKVRGGVQIQSGLNTSNGALTGAGFELEYNAGTAYVTAYNRTGSAWLPMIIRGSSLTLNSSNTTVFSTTTTGTASTFSSLAATSGSITNFTFTTSANTNQTIGTNIPNFKVTGSTKQWATGALATQYFNYFSVNTVSFVGASTATNVYGLYVEAATAGTNATITNNYAAGFSGNVNILSGNLYNSGTQVVSTRNTGWAAFTNTTNKATSYDTATVTLQQLAERVAAMQVALTTHGLIGA